MFKSVALLFPGQGSQYIGMGKNIDPQLLEEANEILGFPISKLMFEGPEEELKLTMNTQPAIVAHSVGLYNQVRSLLDEKKIKVECVMGHSVGEYSALVAASALSFKDAIKAVHLRGKFMQEAVPAGMGKMYALMKVPTDIIISACQKMSDDHQQVMPANFNEPGQTVISGHAKACDQAVAWIAENYSEPHRAIELAVSAPFHSSLMKPAAEKLKKHLEEINFHAPSLDYIANVDAKKYSAGTPPQIVKENLYSQVAGSVLWSQSMAKISPETLCLELGPGRVLMGLARKINRDLKVISMDKEGSLESLEEALS